MAVRRAVATRTRNDNERAPGRAAGVRWWTRRTTQAAAMLALMVVALAVGPSLGVLPSLSERVHGVSRITDVVHDSDSRGHNRH
ncbi:hypothetical protein EHYA_07106 [Embleya hyalina]|uniref:Uncharacterized protein n=1 Tax=Embleya hyalina TaxID=516124 RepID=A0A401YXN5_9ACTN|nr:hypothetical protein EHYA_07106 [Embleya hyalina]